MTVDLAMMAAIDCLSKHTVYETDPA